MKTPQQSYSKLAQALGLQTDVYFKREDLHAYGSHKGRSIPVMIKHYLKEGACNFVISSSGNAALAAIHAVAQHNKNNTEKKITLKIFIGNNISEAKLQMLLLTIRQRSEITLDQVDLPKQAAFQFAKKTNAKLLRQSTDDTALQGYKELAEELNKIQNLQAIFIPTSSGTTAQGLGEAFGTLQQKPQMHIVQTTACHPIAEAVSSSPYQGGVEKESIAGAIVDSIAHRKEKVIDVIKKSNGLGWIVTDEEITDAINIVKEATKIDISANSALSVAGLKKAVSNGHIFNGPVACLITGA